MPKKRDPRINNISQTLQCLMHFSVTDLYQLNYNDQNLEETNEVALSRLEEHIKLFTDLLHDKKIKNKTYEYINHVKELTNNDPDVINRINEIIEDELNRWQTLKLFPAEIQEYAKQDTYLREHNKLRFLNPFGLAVLDITFDEPEAEFPTPLFRDLLRFDVKVGEGEFLTKKALTNESVLKLLKIEFQFLKN